MIQTIRTKAIVSVLAWMAAIAAEATPVVYTDLGIANTRVFRDYNGSSDVNIAYGGAAPAPSQNVSGGVSAWTYGTAGGDPMVIYNDGAGSTDHANYPWIRMRYQQSRADTANIWELPAQGGEAAGYAGSGTMVERSGNPDSTVNAPTVPSGNGIRLDPFGSAAANDVFTADYLMLDRFETKGLGEWDRVGDTQGWLTPNITGTIVANSILTGTSSGNGDSQVTGGPGFDASVFKFVQLRLKASATVAQLFWANGGAYVGSQVVNLGAGDGAFHTYLLDFSNEPTWAGANMSVRLDPVAGVGHTFELDYIRASAGAMIPEPSTLTLTVIGLVSICAMRRKK